MGGRLANLFREHVQQAIDLYIEQTTVVERKQSTEPYVPEIYDMKYCKCKHCKPKK